MPQGSFYEILIVFFFNLSILFPLVQTTKAPIEYFTIKCGLKSLLRPNGNGISSDLLLAAIEKQVFDISQWSIELALYIHFKTYRLLCSGNAVAIDQEFSMKNKSFLPDMHQLVDRKVGKRNSVAAAKYPIDAGYAELRANYCELKLYDCSYKNNMTYYAAENFRVAFGNNIWMHAYVRIRKFLRKLHPGKENDKLIYYTLDALFNKKSKRHAHKAITESLSKYVQWDGSVFHHIKRDWYSFVPLFYRIQRFNEANGIKNFRLVPHYRHGRKHIRIDTKTLCGILNSIEKGKVSRENEAANARKVWEDHFVILPEGERTVSKFVTAHHKFDMQFTTNGVEASLLFKRNKKPDMDAKQRDEKIMERVREKFNKSEYQMYVAIDTGARLQLGAVARDAKTGKTLSLTKHKSQTYRYDVQEFKLKDRRIALTKTVMEAKEKDRKVFALLSNPSEETGFQLTHRMITSLPLNENCEVQTYQTPKKKNTSKFREKRNKSRESEDDSAEKDVVDVIDDRHRLELSSMSWNYADFVSFELKHFWSIQNVCETEELAHLKFKQFIYREKELHSMAKQMARYGQVTAKSTREDMRRKDSTPTSPKRSTLVFMGDAEIGANSPIKGYGRTAIRRFTKILSIYCDVIRIGEWRTTKNCQKCHVRVNVSSSPHRFVQCQQCKKVSLI